MLYLDANALVKRYVAEAGSEVLIGAMQEAKTGRSAASGMWRLRGRWESQSVQPL